MKLFRSFFLSGLFLFLFTGSAFAHEQYVLTKSEFTRDMAIKGMNVWAALNNPQNMQLSIFIGIGIAVLVTAYFFFQYSKVGMLFDKKISCLDNFGHVLLRIALAGSLLSSAYFYSFLGPEIPITSIFLGNLLIPIMYVLGILLIFGIFTRIVSALAFLILLMATTVYGAYMFTYFNYFGEMIALLVFGSYVTSVDNKLFGIQSFIKKYKKWEILIIRVTYGISVMYPAITIKLLHPAVILDINSIYRLNQIHWLFPQDPLLIALGTGLAQILVGLFIILGFETRLASFVTFLLYVGSVLFFKEAVWPHYVLIALAFYLVINNGGKLSLDQYIGKRFFKLKQK